MTEQREQVSFGAYLKSEDNSAQPDANAEALKKIEEEHHVDDDRLQRINEIVGVYENQAKESEELLAKKQQHAVSGLDRINAEAAAIATNPSYSLGGDMEQFVTELRVDLPEDARRPVTVDSARPRNHKTTDNAISKPTKLEKRDNSNGSRGPQVISIDLQKGMSEACRSKQNLYKRRQASPTSQVHERLFAIAQERNAKLCLEEYNKLTAKTKVRPNVNKNSTAIVAKNRSEATVDVFVLI